MASYISSDNIIEEFTYIGEAGNSIEHHNHSINILSFHELTIEQKNILLSDCIFNDKNMFSTSMFDDDVSIVFMSTQIEPNLGIYKNRENGVKIAFAEYNKPLTNELYWDGYINKSIECYYNNFTKKWLNSFRNKYEYLGRITPDEYISNLEKILSIIPASTHICLLLGSETPYLNENNDAYKDRHLYYKSINTLLRDFIQTHKRVHLIDFNNYIKGQNDFTDNINHYKRHVYYEAARDANIIISSVSGLSARRKNYLFYLYTVMRSQLRFLKQKILKK